MNIVILDSKTLGDSDFARFQKFGDVKIYQSTKPQEVIQRCKDAEIVITCKVVFSKEVLDSLPNLKLIAITATGVDNIDTQRASELGIEVKNVTGYSTNAVTQHTFMLALGLLGDLVYYDKFTKSGEWCRSEIFTHILEGSKELNGKSWGIIGLGSIGKSVASIAKMFGCKVSYHSTSKKNLDSTIEHKELDDLLSNSQIISIHSPLNANTKNLISKEKISLLQDDAILLNLGRGGIIDEGELANRMLKSNIKFGTDVLEYEPMIQNHPLLNEKIKNRLIITPHTAWAYKETRERLLEEVEKNVKDFLKK